MTNDVLWFVKPSLAFEWSTLYYLDIRQRKQEWLQTNILRRNSKKINAKLKIGTRVAAIAQWIHLRLPSRRPGFEYQTHQLRFYQIIFDLRHVEKTKINKKRSGLAHFKNIFLLIPYSLLLRLSWNEKFAEFYFLLCDKKLKSKY